MAWVVNTARKPTDNKPDGGNGANAPRSKWLTYLIEAAILVLALLLGLAVRFGIYETALVISRSMEPTLRIGDRLLIDHRKSLAGAWRRGDIVTFAPPASWNTAQTPNQNAQDGQDPSVDNANEELAEGEQLLKRVIGLPGETVEVRSGAVSINGQVLRESYITAAPDPNAPTVALKLGPGQYFVMGDNRSNSDDSRHRGPISNGDIRGRAVRLLGPLGRMGALPRPDYNNQK